MTATAPTRTTSAIAQEVIGDQPVVWAPLQGSQESYLSCPFVEALYHGTRGCGKSETLLMDYAQHVGQGYGEAWVGVIFRQEYKQLGDIIRRSQKYFRRAFPKARFLRSNSQLMWEFPDGEILMFRHLKHPDDYWDYHGSEIPFMAFEELSKWPTDECYKVMHSCCRSSFPGMPRKIRSNTNPYGVGFNWIRERFRLAGGAWKKTVIIEDGVDQNGNPEPPRAAIHGHISENKPLLAADPGYMDRTVAGCTSEAMLEAWRDGSWDITAGGMFDDIWTSRNNLPPFEVPATWKIFRAFDWGSSKPFSVGWYAVSDGSDIRLSDGRTLATVRGDSFRIREWYGCTSQPNVGIRLTAKEIAKGIVEREIQWGWRREPGHCRVSTGVADSSIFDEENGVSVARDMEQPVRIGQRIYPGIPWAPSKKGPGSRVAGWSGMRELLAGTNPAEGEAPGSFLPREQVGLFVVGERCPAFMRTVISIPRDKKNMDDVDTDAEDHPADECRYFCRYTSTTIKSGPVRGGY